MFVAPLLALVAVWAVVVPLFQINPRVFPVRRRGWRCCARIDP